MSIYDIEMSYGFGVSVAVEANSKDEAIAKAKELVSEYVSINDGFTVDCGDAEFEQVNFIQKRG